jgi:hypothetical protein
MSKTQFKERIAERRSWVDLILASTTRFLMFALLSKCRYVLFRKYNFIACLNTVGNWAEGTITIFQFEGILDSIPFLYCWGSFNFLPLSKHYIPPHALIFSIAQRNSGSFSCANTHSKSSPMIGRACSRIFMGMCWLTIKFVSENPTSKTLITYDSCRWRQLPE